MYDYMHVCMLLYNVRTRMRDHTKDRSGHPMRYGAICELMHTTRHNEPTSSHTTSSSMSVHTHGIWRSNPPVRSQNGQCHHTNS